jgi:hypothetical protein
VLISPEPEADLRCFVSLETSTIDITVYLSTDVDGLPEGDSADAVAAAINSELALVSGLDAVLLAQGSPAGDFVTATPGWIFMGESDGGADGADAAATGSDTAEEIATLLAGLDGIESAVASDEDDTVSALGTYAFEGGGENYAFTTTAADIVSAFTDPEDPAYNPAVAALMTCALTGSDGGAGTGAGTVTSYAEQALTGGKDIGDDQPLVVGTPAVIGRLAVGFAGTDETAKSAWIATKNDPYGNVLAVWTKFITGS